jgi:hypothetical protein
MLEAVDALLEAMLLGASDVEDEAVDAYLAADSELEPGAEAVLEEILQRVADRRSWVLARRAELARAHG